MAQHDQVIDNATGLAVRTDINSALAALFSSNAGAVEPSVRVAGMLWLDTSTVGQTVLKVRNDANTAWIALNIAATGTSGDQTYAANIILNRPAISPSYGFSGQLATVMRWRIVPGNTAAESTGNAGSNFAIERYSDAGALIDTPLSINRASGAVSMTAGLTVVGALVAASLDLTTPLPVADGGTGGTTQATARTGLGLGSMATATAANYYTKTEVDNITTVGVAKDQGVSAVGSIVMCMNFSASVLTEGAVVAGANIRPCNGSGTNLGSPRAGTWRCLGQAASSASAGVDRVSLFQRIS